MAENKQYVTQPREKGNVMISEDVIATIVAQAVKDVDGIAGLNTKPGTEIIEKLSKKNWRNSIKITIGEHDEVCIDCNVNIYFGQSIVTVAQAAQEAIVSALQSIANLTIAAINLNISGIVRQ